MNYIGLIKLGKTAETQSNKMDILIDVLKAISTPLISSTTSNYLNIPLRNPTLYTDNFIYAIQLGRIFMVEFSNRTSTSILRFAFDECDQVLWRERRVRNSYPTAEDHLVFTMYEYRIDIDEIQ